MPRPGETASPATEEGGRTGPAGGSAGGSAGPSGGPPGGREPTEAELRQQMAELQERLANTPAEVVVANHAYGLFELAALHLSLDHPQLDQARLAIDALGYLVEGLGDRLGEPARELQTALGQMRLAFVQVQAAEKAGGGGGSAGGAGGAGAGA